MNSGIDNYFPKILLSLSNNLMLLLYIFWSLVCVKAFCVHESIFLLVGIIALQYIRAIAHKNNTKNKSAIKNNDGCGKKK